MYVYVCMYMYYNVSNDNFIMLVKARSRCSGGESVCPGRAICRPLLQNVVLLRQPNILSCVLCSVNDNHCVDKQVVCCMYVYVCMYMYVTIRRHQHQHTRVHAHTRVLTSHRIHSHPSALPLPTPSPPPKKIKNGLSQSLPSIVTVFCVAQL